MLKAMLEKIRLQATCTESTAERAIRKDCMDQILANTFNCWSDFNSFHYPEVDPSAHRQTRTLE